MCFMKLILLVRFHAPFIFDCRAGRFHRCDGPVITVPLARGTSLAIPIPNNWMVDWDDQILDNQLHDTESLSAVGYV